MESLKFIVNLEAVNKKTGTRNLILNTAILDATNERDGTIDYLYLNDEKKVIYVRELSEFMEKYNIVHLEEPVVVTLPTKFKAIHKKTENIYFVISTQVLDATNNRGGTVSYLYARNDKLYVREASEFLKKYKLLPTVSED